MPKLARSFLRETKVVIFVLLVFVSFASCQKKGPEEACRKQEECSDGLKCEQVGQRRTAGGVCRCPGDLSWSGDRCVRVQKQSASSKKAALIVTILVPLIAVGFVVACLSVLCCYYAQAAAKNAQKDVKNKNKKYDIELDFYGSEDQFRNRGEDSSEESSSDESDSVEKPKMVREKPSRKNSAMSKVPQLKVNGIVETSLTNKKNGHVLKSESLPNGDAKHIAGTSTPVLDRAVEDRDKGAGYQASMRHLLTQQSDPSDNTSSPSTERPTSAFFISNSRPSTAINFRNSNNRPDSGQLLNPRQRPMSAAGRPLGLAGPYISDSSRLPSSRSASPRPLSASLLQQDKPLELSPEGLSELYDKVVAISDKEEKDKKQQEEEARKKLKNETGNGRRRSSVGKSGSGIEDIRLVRVAANAFKRRRNMKKVKEEHSRKKGKKGSKKFESLVDQIMRIREEEEKRKPPKPKKLNWNNKRRDSRSSDGSSGTSGSRSSHPWSTSASGRPESVAQRVLRERQQKKITASNNNNGKPKVVATNGKQHQQQQQQPLHVSLRMASAKPFTRSQLTERIKQQALLSAAKNYRTPVPLIPPTSLNNNSNNETRPRPPPPPPAPPVDRGEVKPVKSILKKEGVESANKKKGRVNIAFDDSGENNGRSVVKAQVHVVSASS